MRAHCEADRGVAVYFQQKVAANTKAEHAPETGLSMAREETGKMSRS